MPETKNKPPYPFDADAFDLVTRAPSNSDAAAAALLLAADYMRRGKQLPCSLADFLAEAIETAMKKPAQHDPDNVDPGRALLVALHLKANNKRPSDAQTDEVYYFMHRAMEGVGEECRFKDAHKRKVSQNGAAKLAAKEFGISASTATKRFKEFKKTGARRLGPEERQVLSYLANKLVE